MGLAEGAQPLLDQGRVGQHPAVQGGVVHLQTALQEQLLDVTVAERVAQVPRDGLQDQRCLEVPALEIVLRPALQLLGNRAQDHRPPPVRRRICGPQAQRGVNTKNFATRPRCRHRAASSTARLRLPAGKTYRERVVPLHEDAAVALQGVAALRADGIERAFVDELSGAPVRYLFMGHGKLLSTHYLFDRPLRRACAAAGLVDADGHATITAHRFRHTLRTQLAERGAKLHTIMSALGHQSPAMTMVYARISDPEVLRDYQAVLGPGAVIAGPGAEAVRGGKLPASGVEWLKANFLKTELELGHCLRLPAEGPCECDLFFTCSRFVTTPAYAPRLRERHKLELALATDAQSRGWPYEVERHRCTATRIEKLLADLGLDLST